MPPGQVVSHFLLSVQSCVCPQFGDLEVCSPASMLCCVCLVWVCLSSTFLTGCPSRAGTTHESLWHFL